MFDDCAVLCVQIMISILQTLRVASDVSTLALVRLALEQYFSYCILPLCGILFTVLNAQNCSNMLPLLNPRHVTALEMSHGWLK